MSGHTHREGDAGGDVHADAAAEARSGLGRVPLLIFGLADADDFGASVSAFDFNGDPARGIGPLDGRYVRDNFCQAIVDLAELVRFLKSSDELIPNQATELLGVAARATSVSLPSRSQPPRIAVLPGASAPYERAPSTSAIVQLSPATPTMFTGFVADRRYEPDFPPFVPLGTAQRIDNPIELAHEHALAFAASLRPGRRTRPRGGSAALTSCHVVAPSRSVAAILRVP